MGSLGKRRDLPDETTSLTIQGVQMFVDADDRMSREDATTGAEQTAEEVVAVRVDALDLIANVRVVRLAPDLRRSGNG